MDNFLSTDAICITPDNYATLVYVQTGVVDFIKSKTNTPLAFCPKCGGIFGAIAGSRDSVCTNCGYKEPCCE